MKWPKQIVLIRHAQSAYNVLRARKEADAEYRAFAEMFEAGGDQAELERRARAMQAKYALNCSDRETSITPEGEQQSDATGRRLRELVERGDVGFPDVVYVSPYRRTRETYARMCGVWPELAGARVVWEERIREQDHGLSLLYSDWRIFHTLHPEQQALYNLFEPLAAYDYRYPNGENIPDVRLRIRDWRATLLRDYQGKHVWAFTHHLTILGFRADQERLGPEEFKRLDDHEKPVNCGVTLYTGGHRLSLAWYNRNLYGAD